MCVKCARVNPWEADLRLRGWWRVELQGHGGRCARDFIYLFFHFCPPDEADGVTVRSVAIALGEFPAAVAAEQEGSLTRARNHI